VTDKQVKWKSQKGKKAQKKKGGKKGGGKGGEVTEGGIGKKRSVIMTGPEGDRRSEENKRTRTKWGIYYEKPKSKRGRCKKKRGGHKI